MPTSPPRWFDVIMVALLALCLATMLYLLMENAERQRELRDAREQTETYIRWSVHVSAVTGIPVPEEEEDAPER